MGKNMTDVSETTESAPDSREASGCAAFCASTIVLRRVERGAQQSKRAISVHRDHALVTLNVSLNHEIEFEGGQLPSSSDR